MKRKHAVTAIICAGLALAGLFIFIAVRGGFINFGRAVPIENPGDLPVFTLTELAKYDGTDPALPIYIGLDGYVYDVTAGKKYYVPEGSYHFLAGKDSSKSLHMIGGDIIKAKYPIIGILDAVSSIK